MHPATALVCQGGLHKSGSLIETHYSACCVSTSNCHDTNAGEPVVALLHAHTAMPSVHMRSKQLHLLLTPSQPSDWPANQRAKASVNQQEILAVQHFLVLLWQSTVLTTWHSLHEAPSWQPAAGCMSVHKVSPCKGLVKSLSAFKQLTSTKSHPRDPSNNRYRHASTLGLLLPIPSRHQACLVSPQPQTTQTDDQ